MGRLVVKLKFIRRVIVEKCFKHLLPALNNLKQPIMTMGHVVELHFHVTQSASQYEILLKKFVNTLSCEIGSEIQANENSLISIKILFRDKYLNI